MDCVKHTIPELLFHLDVAVVCIFEISSPLNWSNSSYLQINPFFIFSFSSFSLNTLLVSQPVKQAWCLLWIHPNLWQLMLLVSWAGQVLFCPRNKRSWVVDLITSRYPPSLNPQHNHRNPLRSPKFWFKRSRCWKRPETPAVKEWWAPKIARVSIMLYSLLFYVRMLDCLFTRMCKW